MDMGKPYLGRSPGYFSGLAGAILRDARQRAGLSQEELAARAGVQRPLISEYETGKKDPSVTMLARLVDAMDMELRVSAEILTGADRDQYERDAKAIASGTARRDAERLRGAVASSRRLRPEEIEELRGRASA